jgi:hypothetical protein
MAVHPVVLLLVGSRDNAQSVRYVNLDYGARAFQDGGAARDT